MNLDAPKSGTEDATPDEVDIPARWERQANESATAFHAFRCYRDLGRERSLDEVDRRLYQTPAAAPAEGRSSAARPRRRGHISSWSVRHAWVERVGAWDAEVDRQGRIAQIDAIKKMNERHAEAARVLQFRALEALQGMPATDLAAADVLRFLVEACKLERLAVGEVTDRTATESKAPLVLEIVERIVPVRGDTSSSPMAAPNSATGNAAPVTHRLTGVMPADEMDDPAAWELPDEPPPCLRSK